MTSCVALLAMASNDTAWPSLMFDLIDQVGVGCAYYFLAFHIFGILAVRALLVGVVMDRCARLHFTEKFRVLSKKQQLWVDDRMLLAMPIAENPPAAVLGAPDARPWWRRRAT